MFNTWRGALTFAACAFAVFAMAVFAVVKSADDFTRRDVYEGDIIGYHVVIVDERHESGEFNQSVSIQPAADYAAGSRANITVAHNYAGGLLPSTMWEAIYRCDFPDTGSGCHLSPRNN